MVRRFLKCVGVSLEQIGSTTEAAHCYESLSSYITKSRALASNSEQQALAETILLRHCMLVCHSLQGSKKGFGPQQSASLSISGSVLMPFRNWAMFWKANPVQGSILLSEIDIQHGQVRKVWQTYYDMLSMVLQQYMPYPSPSTGPPFSQDHITLNSQKLPQGSKLQQSQELKRVQTIYESLLMKELRFPKANVVNAEIQHWVDQVMANWRVLCGSLWTDKDLVQGSKRAAGRGVLEVCICCYSTYRSCSYC